MIIFLNAINVFTVLVAFVVQILIVRFFGASDSTDIYYLAITITTFLTGLSTGFLTDLFVPFYHDAKTRDFREAQQLSGSLLSLSLGTGALLGTAVYAFSPTFVSLFASGYPSDKAAEASSMLRILSFSIPFATISVVLNSTLNANSFLLASNLANLIAPLSNIVGLVFWGSSYGVTALMAATVFASAISFFVMFLYCKFKVGARFANPFRQRDLGYLLIKNIPVRATNMINLLRGPLTTTALSYFPAGVLTLYSYSERIITVLLGVANSPVTQFYFVRSSELASRKDFTEIRRLLQIVVNNGSLLLGGLFFSTTILFREAFGVLFSGKVSQDDIQMMFLVFLALFPFSYVLLVGLQITTTGLAMKKGRLGLYAALVFLGVLGIVILPLVTWLSLFGLPASLFLAQFILIAVYIRLLNKIEPLIDGQLFRAQIDTIATAAAMILFNFLWTGGQALQLGVNFLFFLVWLARNRKSALESLRFMTTKGEIK